MMALKLLTLTSQWLKRRLQHQISPHHSICCQVLKMKKKYSSQKITPEKKIVVSVEGNIGSGKTLMLNHFAKHQEVQCIEEPIDRWTNVQSQNALEVLYQEPHRWSCTFNLYAMLTRVQILHQFPSKQVRMIERSLHSTRWCFVENSYRSESLNDLEYAVLSEWYEWLIQTQNVHTDLFVYLRTDPVVCYNRIRKRSRKEEEPIQLSFLQDLHNLHEEWLIKQTIGYVPARVLVLDADLAWEELIKIYEEKKKLILCDSI